ncbi:MAG: hypothetical protein PSV17_00425 [Methylotenera sp.]|uniref:hypothetical protein n=1 Tax=Methylotenera sp. TaxID=2051956 RepID=UPI0024884A4A|nr:hypothetical protein [Methylotenera sp.]MDI1307881.1 hypothetical protein [Methylotenera sp.]
MALTIINATQLHWKYSAYLHFSIYPDVEQIYNAGVINSSSQDKRKQHNSILKPPKLEPPPQHLDEISKEEPLTE